MLFILVFVFIIPLNFLLIENFICQLNLLQDALIKVCIIEVVESLHNTYI